MHNIYKYQTGSSIAPMTANSGFSIVNLQSTLGGSIGGGGARQVLGNMFGSGATPTSPWSIAGGIANTVGSFIPKKEQHQSTEIADAAYNQVSNTLMDIPGWGTIAGGIMKVGGFLSDGLTALGIGTDGMTKLDRALDSKFLKLSPIGWVNGLGAKRTRDFKMDQETYEDQGSAYGGTYDDIQDAQNKAGKKYGLFSSRARRKANAAIAEAERKENIIQDINEEAQTNLSAQRYFGNSLRSEMLLNGGYRNMAVGRHGMSLQLISKSREIAKKYKQGGSIKQSIIEAVSPKDIPEFKDEGQIIQYTEIIAVSPEEQEVPEFKDGGSINIIPEGALHAHKHNMDMEGITPKGIPVVSNKEGGEVEQQAEIEREEIIFRLEVTKKLEELEEKYYDEETSQREKDECALEAGKLLVEEILYNTQDNTNKLL